MFVSYFILIYFWALLADYHGDNMWRARLVMWSTLVAEKLSNNWEVGTSTFTVSRSLVKWRIFTGTCHKPIRISHNDNLLSLITGINIWLLKYHSYLHLNLGRVQCRIDRARSYWYALVTDTKWLFLVVLTRKLFRIIEPKLILFLFLGWYSDFCHRWTFLLCARSVK